MSSISTDGATSLFAPGATRAAAVRHNGSHDFEAGDDVPRKGRARRFREARQLKQGFDDGLFREGSGTLADLSEKADGDETDSDDDFDDEFEDEEEDWDPDHKLNS
jgi:glycine/D-amino acid oxidase-like deaminating enzyme